MPVMYGQHSWVAVVVLVAVAALRMLSSNRRRGGRPGGMPGAGVPGARGFTGGPPQRSASPHRDPGVAADAQRSPPGSGAPADTTFTGTAPGWFVDPFVRHEQRYWSGTAWTEHVLDQGSPAIDPPPPSRRPT